MDVVEAIDAWIDEQIDDLTDDELESILEMLDAVSASTLANLDVGDVYDEDIDELVELTGGSSSARAYTNAVLRAALFGEPFNNAPTTNVAEGVRFEDGLDGVEHQNEADGAIDLGASSHHQDIPNDEKDVEFDVDLGDHEVVVHTDDDSQDGHSRDTVAAFTNGDSNGEDIDTADTQPDRDFLSDLADAQFLDDQIAETATHLDHGDFLADLAGTNRQATTTVRPVELHDFDELGPSFLSDVAGPRRRNQRRSGVSRVLLSAFMVLGLAAFTFGMLQLIDSLNDDDGAIETVAGPDELEPTAVPEPTPASTRVPATPTPVDPSAPPPTPGPTPTPAPRIGIRLVTGDIIMVAFPQVDGLPETTRIYDAADDDLSAATEVAWLNDGLGIVDEEGNVLVIDPDASRPRTRLIYEAGDDFGEAVEIASVDGLVAIRTQDGDVNLVPGDGRADPDGVQLIWDADEQGAEATDLSSVDELVLLVLDDGNAQMVVTSSDNAVAPVWIADDQPRAFNVAGSASGILLGVGQGAVARYNLGETDERLESVWDPFTRDDAPAIGYSSAGEDTVIVTGDGSIVLADESGGGPLLWDPENTEIRAFIALGNDAQVVALLETGSVVRIPLDADQLIESIWDITDETLSPANQIIIEPADR